MSDSVLCDLCSTPTGCRFTCYCKFTGVKLNVPLYEDCLASMSPVEHVGSFATSTASTAPTVQGARYNSSKPRYDHIPPAFLKALAQHFTAGNMYKYADPSCGNRNWERGMDIGDLLRGAISHITEYNLGYKYDVDPAMPPGYKAHHLIAAAWGLITAFECERRGIGTDSRPPAQFDQEVKTEEDEL